MKSRKRLSRVLDVERESKQLTVAEPQPQPSIAEQEKELIRAFTRGDPSRRGALDAALLQAEASRTALRILALRDQLK